MFIFRIFYLLIFFVFQMNICQERYKKNNNNDVWITVFIHGILKVPFSIVDYYNITIDSVTDTKYEYMTEYMRNSPDYGFDQPAQDLGLCPIDLENRKRGNTSTAIALIYDQEYKRFNTNTQNLYYTFGWSALLSRLHRELEAKYLYSDLKDELNRLKNQGIVPKVRLIGYSHGGNLILNMAHLVSEKNPDLTIDELILVGTPIHLETDHLTQHSMFKNIYHFYSMSDIPQKIDFLSSKYFFSHRKFSSHCGFTVPKKLKQIQIRITKVRWGKSGKPIATFHFDPQHTELWKFGWARKSYRKKFALNPLPTTSLFPYVIENIKKLKFNITDYIFDIKPALEYTAITDPKRRIKYSIPFPNDLFEKYKKEALEFKPEGYDKAGRAELIKKAIKYSDQKYHSNSCAKCKLEAFNC